MSSPTKEVYTPKGVFPHAASLHQAFAHCGIFLTAASRRSLGRVSVPVWLVVLSDQLRIVAMVGLYPTILANPPQTPPLAPPCERAFLYSYRHENLCGISTSFEMLFPTKGQVIYVLLTRPPLATPKEYPFDLHVLGTPPAFVLSQDQTLQTRTFQKLCHTEFH